MKVSWYIYYPVFRGFMNIVLVHYLEIKVCLLSTWWTCFSLSFVKCLLKISYLLSLNANVVGFHNYSSICNSHMIPQWRSKRTNEEKLTGYNSLYWSICICMLKVDCCYTLFSRSHANYKTNSFWQWNDILLGCKITLNSALLWSNSFIEHYIISVPDCQF